MLTLTASDKKQITELRELAKKRPVKLNEVKETMRGERLPIGDDRHRVVELRAGKQRYRVVFSHEEQPIGPMRHISISSDKALHLEDVNDILKKFGFEAQLTHLFQFSNPPHYEVWLEPIDPKRSALNVLEVISDVVH